MRRALWLLGTVLAACSDPTIPVRSAAYAFDDVLTGDVFHWPTTPPQRDTKLWVDPRGALPRLAQQGLDQWEAQFLYGEFRGIIVADSLDADVLLKWGGAVPPDVPPDTGAPVNACTGSTLITTDSTNTLDDYIRAEVNLSGSFTPEQVAACVVRVTNHELGHVLGILRHSPNPADLMYPSPGVAAPSDGDRRTVEVLYHTAPTIRPRP